MLTTRCAPCKDSLVLFLVEVKVTPSINYYVVTTKAGLPSDAAGRATPPLPALIGAVESYVRQSL